MPYVRFFHGLLQLKCEVLHRWGSRKDPPTGHVRMFQGSRYVPVMITLICATVPAQSTSEEFIPSSVGAPASRIRRFGIGSDRTGVEAASLAREMLLGAVCVANHSNPANLMWIQRVKICGSSLWCSFLFGWCAFASYVVSNFRGLRFWVRQIVSDEDPSSRFLITWPSLEKLPK